MIEKAKADKTEERFKRYVGDLANLWYYQYIDNFHCKPETIEDMLAGIKYLLYSRGKE